MRYTSLRIAVMALLAAEAPAKTVTVEVGKGGLTYSPNTITAAVGDVVEFHFNGQHSAVAGDFKNPCNPAASGGFFSGILDDGSTFSITVENTNPMFFYCSVDAHCENGMVGVLNPGPDTLDSYRSAAASVGKSVSPNAPFGGNMGGGSSMTSATIISKMSSISIMSMPMTPMTGSESMSMATTSSESMTSAMLSKASGTRGTTISKSASVSQSASGSPSTSPSSGIQPVAAGQSKGPILSVAGLALAIVVFFVF